MSAGTPILFRVQRSKLLLPFVLAGALLIVPLFMLSIVGPAVVRLVENGRLPNLHGLIILPALIVTVTVFSLCEIGLIKRFIRPDIIEISYAGLVRTKFGKRTAYDWKDVGEVKAVKDSRGYKVIYLQIPISGQRRDIKVFCRDYGIEPEIMLEKLREARGRASSRIGQVP